MLATAAFGVAPTLASRGAALAYRSAGSALQRQLTQASSGVAAGRGGDGPAPLVLVYPFPNYALAVLPDVAFWYEAHPTGPLTTHLRTHQLLPPELATRPRRRGRVAKNDATLRVIHDEDERVCQAVQRCVQRRSTRPGVLSPLERHNATFARWYSTAMAGTDLTCAS